MAWTIRLEHVHVHELPRARRVEIDDVDRLGALRLPVPGKLHGVVGEHGDVVEVAAPQAYRLAVLDVDGREDDHQRPSLGGLGRGRSPPSPVAAGPAPRAAATKFPSSPRPAAELFSGWNCTAQTLSRATAATTGPP